MATVGSPATLLMLLERAGVPAPLPTADVAAAPGLPTDCRGVRLNDVERSAAACAGRGGGTNPMTSVLPAVSTPRSPAAPAGATAAVGAEGDECDRSGEVAVPLKAPATVAGVRGAVSSRGPAVVPSSAIASAAPVRPCEPLLGDGTASAVPKALPAAVTAPIPPAADRAVAIAASVVGESS